MNLFSRKSEVTNLLLVVALIAVTLPFAVYAMRQGLALTAPDAPIASRLFHAGQPVSNLAIYGHMLAGGLIMCLAPLQMLAVIRRRFPLLHHASGYGIALFACVTGIAGLWYIALQGTIGGPVMDLGFGLYGVLMVIAAFAAVYYARRRDPKHRLWAERLVILAMASWLYRVHYGLWEIMTGGAGSRPDFSGVFDLVQVFAFYLPYLFLHRLLWSRRQAMAAHNMKSQAL